MGDGFRLRLAAGEELRNREVLRQLGGPGGKGRRVLIRALRKRVVKLRSWEAGELEKDSRHGGQACFLTGRTRRYERCFTGESGGAYRVRSCSRQIQDHTQRELFTSSEGGRSS